MILLKCKFVALMHGNESIGVIFCDFGDIYMSKRNEKKDRSIWVNAPTLLKDRTTASGVTFQAVKKKVSNHAKAY